MKLPIGLVIIRSIEGLVNCGMATKHVCRCFSNGRAFLMAGLLPRLSSSYKSNVLPMLLHGGLHVLVLLVLTANNWACEASPTLGCSIEISRDICICYSTGRSDIRDIFHEL